MEQLFGSNVRLQRLMAGLRLESEERDEDNRRRRDAKGVATSGGRKVHVPSPPPSSGTSPIQWLPQETLEYIISLVADSERAGMRETCLVARAWRVPSQAQLWAELVFLPMDNMLEEILQSASCGNFKTEDASFQGDLGGRAPDRTQLIRRLVGQMRGLKKLQIAEHKNIEAELFSASTLRQLSDLTINHCTFLPMKTVLPLAFRLCRLEITGDAAVPPHLVTSLLTPAFASLTTLALNLSDRLSAFTTLISLFPSFASSLVRLELGAPYPTLVPLLAHCSALASLRLAGSIPPVELRRILLALRTPLSGLELCLDLDQHDEARPWQTLSASRSLEALADLLSVERAACPALAGLEELVLVLEGDVKVSADSLAEMAHLRRLCAERGTEVVVDDDDLHY